MQYIETKTILSDLRGRDTFFGIAYNMNLYRGCQHGCVYCDTRSECYRVGDISQIRVKKNAIELLNKELTSRRNKKGTVGTGSMNDPYMPMEKDLQMVKKALEVIARWKFPVHIITKSDLVKRDIEILQAISETYAAVSFTITTAEDELARQLEPYAPVSSRRFEAIEHLAKHGVYTGITFMPVLPCINDTEKNVIDIVKRAKDAGARYIIPMFGLTLRKGSREYLYDFFDKKYPEMKDKYMDLFGEKYVCNSPNHRRLYDVFYELTDKLGINTKMDFYSPEPDSQLSLF